MKNIQIPTANEASLDNWRMLATAIIVQAIRDYEKALTGSGYHNEKEKQLLEEFFMGDWCNGLIAFCLGMNVEYSGEEVLQIAKNAALDNIAKKNEKKQRNILREQELRELLQRTINL